MEPPLDLADASVDPSDLIRQYGNACDPDNEFGCGGVNPVLLDFNSFNFSEPGSRNLLVNTFLLANTLNDYTVQFDRDSNKSSSSPSVLSDGNSGADLAKNNAKFENDLNYPLSVSSPAIKFDQDDLVKIKQYLNRTRRWIFT